MPLSSLSRRQLLAGLTALPLLPAQAIAQPGDPRRLYRGPNIIIARFGGGVRRQETIDPATSHAPYFLKRLVPAGTLYRNMVIGDHPEAVTGHGHGTLYITTGVYHRYIDIEDQPLRGRFTPVAPTIFEYLRQAYALAAHEALIINGEDRVAEDFFNYSNHHLFGVDYRSEVLSLFRFKTWLLQQQLAERTARDPQAASRRLDEARGQDYRRGGADLTPSPVIERFWRDWRQTYGDSGALYPRGDRALTQLALTAMAQLQPRLMMIHYQDPDYVHWGLPHHYTRAIRIIDHGLQELKMAIDTLPAYRENTILVVVPDCGRDSNPLMAIPYQHHFNTRSSAEIFALLVGPGIARGRIIDRSVEQPAIAQTVAAIMRFQASEAQVPVLEEALL